MLRQLVRQARLLATKISSQLFENIPISRLKHHQIQMLAADFLHTDREARIRRKFQISMFENVIINVWNELTPLI